MRNSIKEAETSGALMPSAAKNLSAWIDGGFLPAWATESIAELVENSAWDELNDRFYQNMAFGTGGLRGRTIGRVQTASERGDAREGETPAHPAVGTNVLNDFNVARATVGLFRYTAAYLADKKSVELPKLVIAHDVRHFSRHFCELAASIWVKLGGRALIFDGPRSTPQLSFTVRELRAHAGVVITASHNPPHDNGYKVYFDDGAQIVSPHAEGIIEEVNKVVLSELPELLKLDTSGVVTLDKVVDEAYDEALKELIIDGEVIRAHPPKVVFSPIHGTGGISAVSAMEQAGVQVFPVEAQWKLDPNFPTVKSPNPENAEALSMGIAEAEKVGADIVLATDPDADRLGVAVRNAEGKLVLLTGNQIGALLADYRISSLKSAEILPEEGSPRAALIKTFVTSPMQEAIAEAHGLKTINTLTGFKWIGEKMRIYEEELKAKLFESEGLSVEYDKTAVWTRADLLLDYSTFVVFGGEESYGYTASDRVRDKDANAAVLMFCEMAAYLKSQEMTFPEQLDALYYELGYYEEKTINIYYEGAAGSEKIANILRSYRDTPPNLLNGVGIKKVTDFGKDEIKDVDGKRIPPQDFFFLELDNGYSYAVRGSGTEPKIKFYIFGRTEVGEDDDLESIKASTRTSVDALAEAIKKDADSRAAG